MGNIHFKTNLVRSASPYELKFNKEETRVINVDKMVIMKQDIVSNMKTLDT